jgi:4-amino-4-deoxy-L-arabinose transferase-like glycosyltransferase
LIAYLSNRRDALIWAGIGILTIVLRIALANKIPPDREWLDAAIYDRLAQSLLAGEGYALDGDPTRVCPPSYPFFVASIYAFTGRNLTAIVLVQSLLAVGRAYLVGWLATRIFDRRAGIVAALLVASYPALIYYDTRILREGFTAFLNVATLCAAWRARSERKEDYLLVGGLLAAVSLTRPETIILIGPAALLALGPNIDYQKLLRPAVFVLIPILVGWVPWTVRNQQTFGSWSPVRAGIVSTIWFGSRWAESGGDDQTAEDRAALKEVFKSKVQDAGDAEFEDRFKADISSDLLGRPLWFVRMVGKKAVMFWKDANGVKRTLPEIHSALPVLLNTCYYSLLILAIVAAYVGRRQWPVRTLFITVVIYAATYALLHVRNRYRVPILPIVFILSSGGLIWLWDEVRSRLAQPLSTSD